MAQTKAGRILNGSSMPRCMPSPSHLSSAEFTACLVLTGPSNGETPEKQAAQIMAIYPVVQGQKLDSKHVIPPRGSALGPFHPSREEKEGKDHVDLKRNEPQETTTEVQGPEANIKPQLDSSHKSTAEVQEMLASTGHRASGGSVIDFHGLKRSDTEDSSDEFVDAQG